MILGAPAERWCLDLCGPFCVSDGFRYLFTALDPFSKYGVCVPIRNKEATTVAKVFVEEILLKWGLCEEVLTDLGKEFENQFMTEILRILGVTKLRTSGYRPQTNGACESWHKVLNAMFAKIISENQKDWSRLVSYVAFTYNATTHSATGFSPLFIMTGRGPRWNIDFLIDNHHVNGQTVSEYVNSLIENLERSYQEVRENLGKAAQSSQTWYDKGVKAKEFEIGARVRVYNPRRFKGRTTKWQSFYKDDGIIIKKLNDVTYIVKLYGGKTTKVCHVDKLKLVQEFH